MITAGSWRDMRTTTPPVPPAPPSMVRLAAASLAGTAIEFYDFFVYGTAAAPRPRPALLPTFSALAGTLAAFGTFGVGFLARPLGSVVFGHIGDRYGRRPVMFASLALTGLATVAVGCVPSYASSASRLPRCSWRRASSRGSGSAANGAARYCSPPSTRPPTGAGCGRAFRRSGRPSASYSPTGSSSPCPRP